MAARVPPTFASRASDGAVWEEVEATRRLDPDQRAAALESLCALAAEIVAQHPDPARTLAYQEPRSPDSERLWDRLRARYSGHE